MKSLTWIIVLSVLTITLCSKSALVAQTQDDARVELLRVAEVQVLEQMREAIASRKVASTDVKAAVKTVTSARRAQAIAKKEEGTAKASLEAVKAAQKSLKDATKKEQEALEAWRSDSSDLAAAAADATTNADLLRQLRANEEQSDEEAKASLEALKSLVIKIKKDFGLEYEDDAISLALVDAIANAATALTEATEKKAAAQTKANEAQAELDRLSAILKVEDADLVSALRPLLLFESNAIARLGNATLVELRDAVSSSDSDEKTAKAIKALMVKVGQTTKAVQGVGQKVDDVGTKVTEVKTEVAGVKTEVAGLRADLKKQSASAIKQIVAALGKIKLPKAPEVKEAAETLERDIKVNVSLPDKQFKAMVAQLKKILVILESKDDVDTLKLIHELLKRQAADAAAATKAKQSSQTSYVDHCGRKVLFPRLRRN